MPVFNAEEIKLSLPPIGTMPCSHNQQLNLSRCKGDHNPSCDEPNQSISTPSQTQKHTQPPARQCNRSNQRSPKPRPQHPGLKTLDTLDTWALNLDSDLRKPNQPQTRYKVAHRPHLAT